MAKNRGLRACAAPFLPVDTPFGGILRTKIPATGPILPSEKAVFPCLRSQNAPKTAIWRHHHAFSVLSPCLRAYGLLHSTEYRTRFENDLKKKLPRIPMVAKFREFSKAGRKLAKLHLGYESADLYPATVEMEPGASYRIEDKMRFPKKGVKDVIVYNSGIVIRGIPEEAYDYVVNGKSAIEWVMERYAVTTDKASGIVNDPNLWCEEHGDEKYILNLLLRVITVSVETVKIVKALPLLGIID